jgi:hypothetical protein
MILNHEVAELMEIEEKIKLLMLDMQTLRIDFIKLKIQSDKDLDWMRANLEAILDKLQINPRSRYQCRKCKGTGNKDMSPICDMGSCDECHECNGTGFKWV